VNEDIRFVLDAKTMEALEAYTVLLKKDASTIVNEALKLYFDVAQKQMMADAMHDKDAATDLDYDEFWDGVEI